MSYTKLSWLDQIPLEQHYSLADRWNRDHVFHLIGAWCCALIVSMMSLCGHAVRAPMAKLHMAGYQQVI